MESIGKIIERITTNESSPGSGYTIIIDRIPGGIVKTITPRGGRMSTYPKGYLKQIDREEQKTSLDRITGSTFSKSGRKS